MSVAAGASFSGIGSVGVLEDVINNRLMVRLCGTKPLCGPWPSARGAAGSAS